MSFPLFGDNFRVLPPEQAAALIRAWLEQRARASRPATSPQERR